MFSGKMFFVLANFIFFFSDWYEYYLEKCHQVLGSGLRLIL